MKEITYRKKRSMREISETLGENKAATDEPEWIYVVGRKVIHRFPFRLDNEPEPWLFLLDLAFEGWRIMRRGSDLVLAPDPAALVPWFPLVDIKPHWGLA